MGHVYDFLEHGTDALSFNKEIAQSFNREVYSRLFERLFIDFMIDNNILKDDINTLMAEVSINNDYYIIISYMFSLLSDYYL